MATSEPTTGSFASSWQFSEDAFTFQRKNGQQRATRGWDRVPKSPFKAHPKGRKVWKRYDLRSRPQGPSAEPAVEVVSEAEDEMLRQVDDEDVASNRAVKRRCLDGSQGEEVEDSGLGKAGNYVGTLWEKGVDFLKRKLARRTSVEASDPGIDSEQGGPQSPSHELRERPESQLQDEARPDEATGEYLPLLNELLTETQHISEPSNATQNQTTFEESNGTTFDQDGDQWPGPPSRRRSVRSISPQEHISEQTPVRDPAITDSGETPIDISKSVDTQVVEKIAPAVTHELVTQEVHHIREEVVTREVHYHDVYHRVQPVIDIEVLPPKHYVQANDGRLIEVSPDELPGRQKIWDILGATTGMSSKINNPDCGTSPEKTLHRTDASDSTPVKFTETVKKPPTPKVAEAWHEATMSEDLDVRATRDDLGQEASRVVSASQSTNDDESPPFMTRTVITDIAQLSPRDGKHEPRETNQVSSSPNKLQLITTQEQKNIKDGDGVIPNHSTGESALIADDLASYDEVPDLQHQARVPNFTCFEENLETTELFNNLDTEISEATPFEEHTKTPNNALNRPTDDAIYKTNVLEPATDENSTPTAPSTPPPTETPNPLEERTYVNRLSDTTMLKNFLSRAKARKEAANQTSTTSPIPKPKASPPKSPARVVLADLDTNPPSPKKNTSISDRPGTPPPAPEKADISDLKDSTTSCRRSARKRNPVTPSSQKTIMPVGAPSFIPVRRADGAEPVILQKSEAQELATLTKSNTRKNKGAAKLPKVIIESITEAELAEAAGMSDKEIMVVKKGKKRKLDTNGGKVVTWDEQLVYYREMNDNETEDDDGGSRSRTTKRFRGLGAAVNGTSTSAPVLTRKIGANGKSKEVAGKKDMGSRIATPMSVKVVASDSDMPGDNTIIKERKSRIGIPATTNTKKKLMDVVCVEDKQKNNTAMKTQKGIRNATPAKEKMVGDVVLGEEKMPATLKRKARVGV
ncbi:MAG: hypothetical protein M1812_004892 [Candelaria pacifica]|nr:MAG: hypothetical protein M1812_004892 [Candelaria pacifica]